jgi:hypothetical protein
MVTAMVTGRLLVLAFREMTASTCAREPGWAGPLIPISVVHHHQALLQAALATRLYAYVVLSLLPYLRGPRSRLICWATGRVFGLNWNPRPMPDLA